MLHLSTLASPLRPVHISGFSGYFISPTFSRIISKSSPLKLGHYSSSSESENFISL